jgi:hypothetical protein
MLLRENNRLHSGDLEAFAAAHVLAGHEVVLAQHVGAGFGKAGAIAFIAASGQLSFLGANNPGDFVLSRLMAVRAVQCGHLLFWPFVEEISLFHGQFSPRAMCLNFNYCSFAAHKLWQDVSDGEEEAQAEEVQRSRSGEGHGQSDQVKAMARAQIGAPPAGRVVPDSRDKKTDKHKPTLGKMLEED